MMAFLGTILAILIESSKAEDGTVDCRNEERNTTRLLPLPQCNLTLLSDGRLLSTCKVLIEALPEQWFVPSDPEVMTFEEELVSCGPVKNDTLFSGQPVVLSLVSAKIIKWDDFPARLKREYKIFPIQPRDNVGGFSIYYLLVFIRRLQFRISFTQPPAIAVTNCTKTTGNGRLRCKVFGFIDKFFIPEHTSPVLLPFVVNNLWHLNSSVINTINFTFAEAVKRIPATIFSQFKAMRIARVIFYACNFKQIHAEDIPHMRYLNEIHFVNAPLDSVHPNAFDLIPDIKNISLIGSKLAAIPKALFSLKHLRSLDMSCTMVAENSSFYLNTNVSGGTSSATSLILAWTPLRQLKNGSFCRFPSLKFLDISDCSIENVTASPFFCLTDLLELNMARNGIVWINPLGFKGLKSLEMLNLQQNKLKTFPPASFFNMLPALLSLSLSSNKIIRLEMYGTMKTSLQNLELSGNSMYNWTPPIFSLMPSLAYVNISRNQLYEMKDKMYEDIKHAKVVDICSNPWDCASCSLNYLHALLDKSAVDSSSCAFCKEPESLIGMRPQDVKVKLDICVPHYYDYYVFAGVPIIFTLLVSSVTGYSLYVRRWYIRYLLLYLRINIRNLKRQSRADTFMWDAFLSYHDSDANWAREFLLSRLESPDMGFRICVAERDFIPGIPIADNICRCISQSRVSIFIVSKEFCQSRWCMFEVTLAQHRLFECERDEDMVFIKRNIVEESELSPVLSFLTKSRTYIDACDDDGCAKQQHFFWLKLQAALKQ